MKNTETSHFRTMTEYNGYTNKPTWLVALWIDNDYREQAYWVEQAESFLEDETKEESITALQFELQEHYADNESPLDYPSLYTDLLGFIIAFVNWAEVAEGLIELALENMETE